MSMLGKSLSNNMQIFSIYKTTIVLLTCPFKNKMHSSVKHMFLNIYFRKTEFIISCDHQYIVVKEYEFSKQKNSFHFNI